MFELQLELTKLIIYNLLNSAHIFSRGLDKTIIQNRFNDFCILMVN